MAALEELTRGAVITGILADQLVTVVDVVWYGSACIELTYKDAAGRPASTLLYRENEPALAIATAGLPWSFDADGTAFRLVSEAQRIRLAYLFDPVLAVHTSLVDPLPHQITAVYEEMLPRRPLRFLLADDPGAGKTIMTGLLIKELLIRGDLRRCLIVCPGSLTAQWQDELYRRFGLDFAIVSRDSVETARSGNPFTEHNLVIARLDHLARNEDVQARLGQTDWDLVVCDEAHKMSATFFGGEVKETKRYKLGKLLAGLCRHFLLLTATPHNGKEEDFQLFMALLDGDRFEGRFRDGVHLVDTSDLMRRLLKEQLLKFDGTPLFPERWAYTVNYRLSPREAALYSAVTEYVQEEMNRADRLALEGEKRRGNTVGFALTILQRRLASSPEAIYQSLRRRRERLERRFREESIARRSHDAAARLQTIREQDVPYLTDEDIEDLDDAPESEVERVEEEVADKATAARTVEELRREIESLKRLEALALEVRQSKADRKWDELSRLLQGNAEMFDPQGRRRKLIIFTEHRDTLTYLRDRIGTLIGRAESVVVIHGGSGREERRKAQEQFTQDPDVQILVATDAAGEGVNLQRAHLVVNYDLPWNPNRLEQRFGRVHRIGQTEVCHCWNLVAEETREGDVFARLFKKLEDERGALNGKVFDVLGNVFAEQPLRQLLLEAIRYGDQPEVRARLHQKVDSAMDPAHLQALIEERALAHDTLGLGRVLQIKAEMERAEARRLQPHFIASFFLEAFRSLGGSVRERENGRFEISYVPSSIRARDRQIGTGEPVLAKYERVTFEKDLIAVPGKPLAAFICPGHPLLDATIDLILERHRNLLKRGTVLVDPTDPGTEPRALVYLEHGIQDGRQDRDGNRHLISKRLVFVEIDASGAIRDAGYAPYLNYRPLQEDERAAAQAALCATPLREGLESRASAFAAETLIPQHLREVRARVSERVERTRTAVRDRLTAEIRHWDHRAIELREQERAGKQPRMNPAMAQRRADELQARLRARLNELQQELQIAALPPVVVGGALIVPAGALIAATPDATPEPDRAATPDRRSCPDRAAVERLAVEAVLEAERRLGREPRDVSAAKLGYDIESRRPEGGPLLFIEVKGRAEGADTVTVTRNEILTALNTPDQFILAVVEVNGNTARPQYVRRPFRQEPDFGVTSVTYDLRELLARAGAPA